MKEGKEKEDTTLIGGRERVFSSWCKGRGGVISRSRQNARKKGEGAIRYPSSY